MSSSPEWIAHTTRATRAHYTERLWNVATPEPNAKQGNAKNGEGHDVNREEKRLHPREEDLNNQE
tara:strand:- start:18 stop:212 length:195 start_codon:yes stop_codon:yes gene_type:complete